VLQSCASSRHIITKSLDEAVSNVESTMATIHTGGPIWVSKSHYKMTVEEEKASGNSTDGDKIKIKLRRVKGR